MLEAKQKGFADRQIAHMLDCLESEVYKKRKENNINRVYKLVDTCAAEFKALTPYYYSTFEQEITDKKGKTYTQNESSSSNKKKIIVLGSGPNRIGQGIEFDYCCVHGVLAASECGYETIMINCNPETVSTDFDVADKLYFEPVFWEHIYDIIEHEKPEGVIVQLGGQTALKLAEKLDRYGVKIIGTTFKSLDLAEDRGSFSELLKENNIPYPEFGVAETADQALKLSDTLNFPILVRPSYVLGGQGMKIVINKEDLEAHVVDLLQKIPNNKLLLDHYLDGAIEAEADAICDGENVQITLNQAVSNADHDLFLYDSDQLSNPLEFSANISSQENINFSGSGIYYLVVTANQNRIGSKYSLSIEQGLQSYRATKSKTADDTGEFLVIQNNKLSSQITNKEITQINSIFNLKKPLDALNKSRLNESAFFEAFLP